jgi:hypothetical protein
MHEFVILVYILCYLPVSELVLIKLKFPLDAVTYI